MYLFALVVICNYYRDYLQYDVVCGTGSVL